MSDTEELTDEEKIEENKEDENQTENQDESEDKENEGGSEDQEDESEDKDDKDESKSEDQEDESEDKENEDESEKKKTRRREAGVSYAYDDEIGDFDEVDPKEQKEKKPQKDKKNPFSLPKRDKSNVKATKEKNIMELFWTEFIVAFYEWGINKSIDFTLDFVEWILIEKELKQKQEKEEKKTDEQNTENHPYVIGKKIYDEKMKKPMYNIDFAKKAHQEIMDNIEKEGSGAPALWKIWGKEPTFYPKLSNIAKKVKENPECEEAKDWEDFKNVPNVMQNFLSKEKLLQKYSIMTSALNELVSDAAEKLPEFLTTNVSGIDADLKNENITGTELKLNSGKKVAAILAQIDPKDEEYKVISEKLNNIKVISESSETDVKKIRKEISNNLKDVISESKKMAKDPVIRKNRMMKKSSEMYAQISDNIDKIYEKYSKNPDERQKVSQSYMATILNSIQEARDKTNSLSKFKLPGVKKIKKDKARQSVKDISNNINNFEIEGTAIGSLPKAKRSSKSPILGREVDIFNAIKVYGVEA